MAWQLKDVSANRHNDNYTVTVEYIHNGASVVEHTGQVGPSGGAAAFVRDARRALQRVREAARRKSDAESAGRFAALVDALNAE